MLPAPSSHEEGPRLNSTQHLGTQMQRWFCREEVACLKVAAAAPVHACDPQEQPEPEGASEVLRCGGQFSQNLLVHLSLMQQIKEHASRAHGGHMELHALQHTGTMGDSMGLGLGTRRLLKQMRTL